MEFKLFLHDEALRTNDYMNAHCSCVLNGGKSLDGYVKGGSGDQVDHFISGVTAILLTH